MQATMAFQTKAWSEDRVRANTEPQTNERIDREFERKIRLYATLGDPAISSRLAELDREWDIERTLEANAATLALLGTVLGVTSSRRWLALPLIVSGFLLNHAVKGWCPPLPLFRRMGVRTRMEIERERHALKMLRGDFPCPEPNSGRRTADEIVREVLD